MNRVKIKWPKKGLPSRCLVGVAGALYIRVEKDHPFLDWARSGISAEFVNDRTLRLRSNPGGPRGRITKEGDAEFQVLLTNVPGSDRIPKHGLTYAHTEKWVDKDTRDIILKKKRQPPRQQSGKNREFKDQTRLAKLVDNVRAINEMVNLYPGLELSINPCGELEVRVV